MDRGAWWAAVHGVAKSWTRLSSSHFLLSFGSLIIGYGRSPSLKQQLFYTILGFALSEAMGLFLPDGGRCHPLRLVKEPFPPPIVLSLMSPSVLLQATWGKRLAQGLKEGRQINLVLIRKKDLSTSHFWLLFSAIYNFNIKEHSTSKRTFTSILLL